MGITIKDIRENPVALRTVNRESEEYLQLVDSIKQVGVLTAITVRNRTEEVTNEDGSKNEISYYELIDGLHRFCAAKDAGLKEIPCNIVDFNDSRMLEAQIMANVHRIETKPIEYTNQLKKILSLNPTLTATELGTRLGKSVQWIEDRLSLGKIANETVKDLINEGKIPLLNAYSLAKLPENVSTEYVDMAMTLPPSEFVPKISQRMEEIRKADRQGRDNTSIEFAPVAYAQKLGDIKRESDDLEVLSVLISKYKINDVYEAARIALKWVLHLDPDSVEEQRKKDEEIKRKRAEVIEKRKAELASKKAAQAEAKAKEAAEIAAKLNENL